MPYELSDLKLMSIPELQKLGKEIGVTGMSKIRKVELVQKVWYRITNPCQPFKVPVNNRCKYPDDLSTMTKKELIELGVSVGISNPKKYKKDELVRLINKIFNCAKDQHVSKISGECVPNLPAPRAESTNESDSEPEEESDSDSDSEPEEETVKTEQQKNDECFDKFYKEHKDIMDRIAANADELYDKYKYELPRDREAYFLYAQLEDADACLKLSDEKKLEIIKQLDAIATQRLSVRKQCQERIDKFGEMLKKKYPEIEEDGFLNAEEDEEFSRYDINSYEDLINTCFMSPSEFDTFLKVVENDISRVFNKARQRRMLDKSRLKEVATDDKSGAVIDSDIKLSEFKEGDEIPCESFAGKSSCENEFGPDVHEGIKLRRCVWDQTSRPNSCKVMTGDKDERLRKTLGLSKDEFAKLKSDRVMQNADEMYDKLEEDDFVDIDSEKKKINEQLKIDIEKLRKQKDEIELAQMTMNETFDEVILKNDDVSDDVKEEAMELKQEINKFSALEKMLVLRGAQLANGTATTEAKLLDIAADGKIDEKDTKIIEDMSIAKVEKQFEYEQISKEVAEQRAELAKRINMFSDTLRSADEDTKNAVSERMGVKVGGRGGLLQQIKQGVELKKPVMSIKSACSQTGKFWNTVTQSCVDECLGDSTFQRGNECLARDQMTEQEKLLEIRKSVDPDEDEDEDEDEDWMNEQ